MRGEKSAAKMHHLYYQTESDDVIQQKSLQMKILLKILNTVLFPIKPSAKTQQKKKGNTPPKNN